MKFVFNIEKLKKHQIQHARRHNLREQTTESVIKEKNAWFNKTGRFTTVEWNENRLSDARKLSKRKDAIEAISFILQIGNQTDWRDPPTLENPAGAPKSPPPLNLLTIEKTVLSWAEYEFGRENIVSIELHLDESTPHFHIICTPIFENQLIVKKWVSGKGSLTKLRKSAHAAINSVAACDYGIKGKGGNAHDETHGAGRRNGPQPALKNNSDASLLKKATVFLDRHLINPAGPAIAAAELLELENEQLKIENDQLKQAARQQEIRIITQKKYEHMENKVKNLQITIHNLNSELTKTKLEISQNKRLLDTLKINEKNELKYRATQAERDSERAIFIEEAFQAEIEILESDIMKNTSAARPQMLIGLSNKTLQRLRLSEHREILDLLHVHDQKTSQTNNIVTKTKYINAKLDSSNDCTL
jgi:hypothetical protein